MVKLKNEPTTNDWIRQEMDRIDRENPVIDTRWYVYEYTPGYNTGGYYDVDVPAESVIVSPYFDSEKKAKSWLAQHEPDDGKKLIVGKQNLRRRTYTEWTNH